jgi:hypothetical protein
MQMAAEKVLPREGGHDGEFTPFRPPLLPALPAVNLSTAFPGVRLVRSHAPARANAVRSQESLDVKADRSALSLDAGSVRRGRNSRGCYHLMNCARHAPHYASASVADRSIRRSTKCASKIHVTPVTVLFRFCGCLRRSLANLADLPFIDASAAPLLESPIEPR